MQLMNESQPMTKPMSLSAWFLLAGAIALLPATHALSVSALWKLLLATARFGLDVALVIAGLAG